MGAAICVISLLKPGKYFVRVVAFVTCGAAGAVTEAEAVPTDRGAAGRETPEREDSPYAFDAICADSFSAEVWGRRSSVLGADAGDFFRLADLVQALSGANASLQSVGGSATSSQTMSVSPQPKRQPGSLMDFFRNSTLVVSGLETMLPQLAAWSRSFARSFGVTTETTLYLSPPGTQALSLHNDKTDILALQAFGRKKWSVWDLHGALTVPNDSGLELTENPFRHVVTLSVEHAVPLDHLPRPAVEARMQPGGLLYLPRGALHVASTAGLTGSSAHLSIGILTQSFSYAIAAFHLSAEQEMRERIAGASWDTHRFRQALMRIVDDRVAGVEFRQSLPLGWVTSLVSSQSSCPWQTTRREVGESVKNTLETLVGRVMLEAPEPPDLPIRLSAGALDAVAGVFFHHLDKFDKEIEATLALTRVDDFQILEFPPSLHVLYIAWNVDDYGAGEVEVRFSWCGQKKARMVGVAWPASILPMLEVVATSTTLQMDLASLGAGSDPLPRIIFALELTKLPLNPPFRLLPRSKASEFRPLRDPDCGRSDL